jgi:hypothetical protein
VEITRSFYPKTTGKLGLRNIVCLVGDEQLTHPDIMVDVVKEDHVNPPPSANQGFNPFGSFGGMFSFGRQKMRQSRPPRPNTTVRGNDVFAQASLGKTTYYKGEQIIVDYALFLQPKVLQVQLEKYPDFPGFFREDLILVNNPANAMLEPVDLPQGSYNRRKLMRVALYPLQEGSLKVDTLATRVDILQADDQDDDMFFGLLQPFTNKTVLAKTKEIMLTILPLPTLGKPADFAGIVGECFVASATDKMRLKTSEALKLNINVRSTSPLASLKLEPFKGLPFDAYEPSVHSSLDQDGEHQKIFQFIAIAEKPGKFIIPPTRIAYFDPKLEQYKIQQTDPITIEVTGEPVLSGNGKNQSSMFVLPGMQPLKNARQASSLDFDPDWRHRLKILQFATLWVWVFVLAKLLILVFARFRQRPLALLFKQLNQLQTPNPSYAQVDRLLDLMHKIIEHCFGFNPKSFTYMQLMQALVKELGPGPQTNELLESLQEFINVSDQIKYAGTGFGPDHLARVYGNMLTKLTFLLKNYRTLRLARPDQDEIANKIT